MSEAAMAIPFISDKYRLAQKSIREEIQSLDASQLSGTTVQEWIEYFVEKYSVHPIELLGESPLMEPHVKTVPQTNVFGERFTAEKEYVLVGLPVDDNDDLPQLLGFRATRWYPFSDPSWEYRDGYLFLEIDGTNPELIKTRIEEAKNRIEWLNNDINNGNNELPSYIEGLIKLRMETVGARTQTFEKLAEVLGAELKPTPTTQRRLTQVPRVRDSIRSLRRPQPRQKEIPRLDPETFGTILDVIDAQGVSYERTPATVAKLDEPDIRNLVLASLNAAFNLGAVGEVFSNRGKTDIYLAVPEGGIFIAECKMWTGPKTLEQAVSQILGYLTWRDAYGLVVVFSRNQGFSGVLSATPERIGSLESLRGEVNQVDQHHWSARHAIPGDEQQTVEIHYLVYNVYTSN